MSAVAAFPREITTFFAKVAEASQRALLLDYDGTLAPFHPDRLSALPYPGVPELLAAIVRGHTNTRLVLITGRPAKELKSLLPLAETPEIWGSHGLERLKPDGGYELPEIPPQAVELLSGIDRRLEAEGFQPLVELKPGAAAVHWRNLSKPLAHDIRQRILAIWNELPPQETVFLTEFDGGMEFRLRIRDKGDAVRQLLSELPESAPVAYLGDDLTDEDAFRALKNRGLGVLVRDQFRPTAADTWIRPPQGVLKFLTDWLRACGEEVEWD